MPNRQSLIEKYREFLPVTDKTPVISLGEGYTPLMPARNLSKKLGRPDLNIFLKLEGLNPTGSFKDRGMSLAISKALEEGSRSVICASTGNTSASAAAFAAKAGLTCYVLLPEGKVATGKLAQAILYGAKIIQVDGNFDQALDLVRSLAREFGIAVVNSINPNRLEGQKTAALEVIEQLGKAPDFLFIPVGNAGNISAYWRGFKLASEKGLAESTPRMFGFEAEGAAAIVRGVPVEKPETVATAIRIGNPASWKEAVAAAHESSGKIDFVSDDQILEAYQLLAGCEGVFCEPSSAASIAGLAKAIESGTIPSNQNVVCVLTGNGLKDPDMPLRLCQTDLTPVPPSLSEMKAAMRL
jgi:threonine synthase